MSEPRFNPSHELIEKARYWIMTNSPTEFTPLLMEGLDKIQGAKRADEMRKESYKNRIPFSEKNR